MRKTYFPIIFILLSQFLFTGISISQENHKEKKIRYQTDTVGFSSRVSQMDEFMRRLLREQYGNIENSLNDAGIDNSTTWKAAICPHDDYTYVGYLYPALLTNIKAKTIILFGVSHKAKQFGLENQIIFDSFSHWHMPYGEVPVSGLRNEIINKLSNDICQVNDSAQASEHSTEAIIPFLQYFNKDVQIISILVPNMPFERMNEISTILAGAITEVIK